MKKLRYLPILLGIALCLSACGEGSGETEVSASPAGTAVETASSEAAASTAEAAAEPTTVPAETEAPEEDSTFFAGFGRADITPWESVPLSGYGNAATRLSTNVLDPLTANCLALRDGNGETVLIFMLDLVGVKDTLLGPCRAAVTAATGVAGDHIYIACSHTHSGPEISLTGSGAILRYREYLYQGLAKAAVQALGDLAPAAASSGETQILGLNFVRHYLLGNGSYAGDNYGDFGAAPIVGYETEADHTIRLLRFEREDAKDILLVHFQVHPHRTGGMAKTDISADIVARIRNYVEEREDVYCSYVQGGSGNINPTSYKSGDTLTSDYKEYGVIFGKKVLAALPDLKPIRLGPIRISGSVTFTGTVDHTKDHLVPVATAIYEVFAATGDRPRCVVMGKPYDIHSCYHAKAIIDKSLLGSTLDLELDALSFGEVGLVTAPYEMFDVNASFVRDNSPYPLTLVMAYCNGYSSYVAADYAYDNTCYEADQCRFVKGTAEELASAMVGLLEELHRQETPTGTVTVTPPEREDPLAGLNWDGRVYYNYGYAYYQSGHLHTRVLNGDGKPYRLTLLAQDGSLEDFLLGDEALVRQADMLSLLCLWRDKDGRIAAVTSPDRCGCAVKWNQFVMRNGGHSVSLNSSSDGSGAAGSLTVSADTPYAMVPADPLAVSAGKASFLLFGDRITAVEDAEGSTIAVFIVSREGIEGDPGNLAAKAAVSYTYPLILSNKYYPYLINDGNVSAGLTECAGFQFREGGEILFEFSGEYTVTGYRLINQAEPEAYGGVKDYEIYTSADGAVWTLLDRGSGMSSGSREKRLDTGVRARFVKLAVTDAHCNTYLGDDVADKRVIRIAEIEIFGAPEEIYTENLARKARVTTSYAPYPGSAGGVEAPIERIIDGDHRADYSTSCRYHWSEDGEILFAFDSVRTVTGYRMYNYEWPYQWCINEAWSVYGSLDGEHWTRLAEGGIDCSSFTESVKYASELRGGEPDGGDFEAPAQARYVKLVIDRVFVGAGDNTRGSNPNGGQMADVRMYEFQILGY